jgi:hypothetical protein
MNKKPNQFRHSAPIIRIGDLSGATEARIYAARLRIACNMAAVANDNIPLTPVTGGQD